MVVGSSTGEFESGFEAGGQTREHALLVRSLGVTQIVVAVNKLDNVSIKCRQTGSKSTDCLKLRTKRYDSMQLCPCQLAQYLKLKKIIVIYQLRKYFLFSLEYT